MQAEVCNFIEKETLAQVFSCGFCESFKNTFFIKRFHWLLLQPNNLHSIANQLTVFFMAGTVSLATFLRIRIMTNTFRHKFTQAMFQAVNSFLHCTNRWKFFIKDFISKCDQIRSFQRIYMENFIFYAVL